MSKSSDEKRKLKKSAGDDTSSPDSMGLALTRRTLIAGGASIAAAPGAFAQAPPQGDLSIEPLRDGFKKQGARLRLKAPDGRDMNVFDLPMSAFGSKATSRKPNSRTLIIEGINFGADNSEKKDAGAPLYELQLSFKKNGVRWVFRFDFKRTAAQGELMTSNEVDWLTFVRLRPAAAGRFSLNDAGQTHTGFPAATVKADWFPDENLLAGLFAPPLSDTQLALGPDLSFYWSSSQGTIVEKRWEIAVKAVRFGHCEAGSGPVAAKDVKGGSLPSQPCFAVIGVRAQPTERILLARSRSGKGDVHLAPAKVAATAIGWQQWLKLTAATKLVASYDAMALSARAGIRVAWSDKHATSLPASFGKVARWREAGKAWQVRAEFPVPEVLDLNAEFGRIGFSALNGKTVEIAGEAPRPSDFDVNLTKFHADLRFTRAYRNVPGADFTHIGGGGTEVVLTHVDVAKKDGANVALGRGGSARLDLDCGHIRVKRGADLLDLKYEFRAVDLVLRGNSGELVARQREGQDDPRMVVELAPQHVAEQAFLAVEPPGGRDEKKQWPALSAIPLGTPVSEIQDEKLRKEVEQRLPPGTTILTREGFEICRDITFGGAAGDKVEQIARSRLSGPSRVAFLFEPSSLAAASCKTDGKSPVVPFTMAGLTGFARLKPAVVKRARLFAGADTNKSPDGLAADELSFYGLSPSQTWNGRLGEVRKLMRGPEHFDTSIELPYRLILSPDDTAVWLTPPEAVGHKSPAPCSGPPTPPPGAPPIQPGPIERRTPLWRMELYRPTATKSNPRGGVRAIASPDLDVENIGQGKPRRQTPIDRHTGYRTPLSEYDRQEIVVLSSMQGLPVLRRNANDGKAAEGQILPPENYELKNDAGEGVLWAKKTAIYKPPALDVTELMLTSLGGSITLDANFEPPVGVGLDGPDQAPPDDLKFTVQRWRHTAALGRDMFVEVVYKGYLYPYGHDCSLVKFTERKFIRHAREHLVAYLIQHMYLRVGDPVKAYPAYQQPDRGRRFPARQIAIVTKRTPTIQDPTAEAGARSDRGAKVAPGGRIVSVDDKPLHGLVFWPRDATGGEVRFELQIDDDTRTVSQPLIFVDYAALNTPDTLAGLNAYYRRLSGEPDPEVAVPKEADPRVVVRHGNVPRRYADEKQPLDAAFETEQWTMSVDSLAPHRDMAEKPAAPESHRFDPLLLGANQPPFFPAIKSARIRLKQLERLAGAAAQSMDVTYFKDYLQNGFTPDQASEMYLHAESNAGAQLSFTTAGDRSGGLGKPNAEIVAFSRKYGPVAKGSSARHDDIAAYAKFDPASFFQSDAKILGLLKLSDILEILSDKFVAPTLKQVVHYGLGTDTCGDTLRTFTTKLSELQLPKLLPPPSVYKDLDAAKNEFDRSLEALKNAIPAENGECSPEVFARCGELFQAGMTYADVVARIAAEPAGPLKKAAKTQLEALQRAAEAVPGLADIKDGWRSHAMQRERAQAAIRSALSEMLSNRANADLRRSLFALRTSPLVLAKIGVDLDATLQKVIQPPFVSDAVAALDKPQELRTRLVEELGRAIQAEIAKEQQALTRLSAEELKELKAFAAKIDDWIPSNIRGLLFGSLVPPMVQLTKLRDDLGKTLEREKPALKDIGDALKRAMNAYLKLTAGTALGGLADTVCRPAGAALFNVLLAITPAPRPVGQVCLPSDAAACGLAGSEPGYVFACVQIAAALRTLDCVGDELGKRSEANAEFKSLLADYAASLRALSKTLRAAVEQVAKDLLELEARRRALDKWLGGTATDFVGAVCTDGAFPTGELTLVAERRIKLLHAVVQAVAGLKGEFRKVADIEEVGGKLAEDARKRLHALIGPQRTTLAAALAEVVDQLVGLAEASSAMLSGKTSEAGKRLAEAAKLLDTAIVAIGEVSPVSAEQLRIWRDAAVDPPEALDKAAAEFAKVRAEIKDLAARARNRLPRKILGAEIPNVFADAVAAETDLVSLAGLSARASAPLSIAFGEDPDHGLLQALGHLYGLPRTFATDDLKRAVGTMAQPIVEGLLAISRTVAEAHKRLDDSPQEHTPERDALNFLLRKYELPPVPVELEAQIGELKRISNLLEKKVPLDAADVTSLQRIADAPAVMDLAEPLNDLAIRLLRGDIAGLIDLSTHEKRLRSEILRLIPTRVVLDYEFKHTLQLPKDLEDIVVGMSGKQLALKSTTTITALDGANPTTVVKGSLPGFGIKLFGSALHAVTLNFADSKFSSTGGPPALNFRIEDVEIGEQLAFLKQLQTYLNLGDGDGLSILPTTNPMGMRVRYGIGLGTIGIGVVSFINVNVNAGAALPFEDRPARFTVALSTRDNPFLISAFPFGGGGYFQLEAEADKLVAFESSFDYGGVAAFGFGPLNGVGRVTSGIFVRKSVHGSAEIEGQFFAGGSARIACFGVSAALSVRLRQDKGGAMSGSAIYTFGFKLFVKTIEFNVPVWRQQGKGFSNASLDPSTALTRYAEAKPPGVVSDAEQIGPLAQKIVQNGRRCCEVATTEIDSAARRLGIAVRSHTRCQGDDFAAYMQYFMDNDIPE